MYVAVDEQNRMKPFDDSVEGDKPDVGGVLCLGDTERGRMRDEKVKLAAGPDPFRSDPKFEVEDAPPHLCLRVLIRTGLIPKAPAQPGDAQAVFLENATVHVVATLWSGDRGLRLQR